MTALTHTLDRTILIRASPEIVFRYFTDSARWAAWWGAGSFIEARPGGEMRIRYPDGSEAVGTVLEVAPVERIVFTYGYATGQMIPPGGSRVTIRLDPDTDGTAMPANAASRCRSSSIAQASNHASTAFETSASNSLTTTLLNSDS